MSESHAAEHGHHELGFIRKYIFSTDHKIIGIQYMITAMAMAVIGGIAVDADALPARAGRRLFRRSWRRSFRPRSPAASWRPEFYISLVTMHGTIMVFFLFTAVLTGGFGNFLIPLQIGARDMAFPFLNALSYWIFLVSCIVIFSRVVCDERAPDGRMDVICAAQRRSGCGARAGHGRDLVDRGDRAYSARPV